MLLKNFPQFDLGDYILREKQDKDLHAFFNYYSDLEVNRYILAEIPRNLEEARFELSYWRNVFYNNSGIYFAIAKKSNDEMIGTIGLTSYNRYNNRIELSYDMAKEFWGRGIMAKAVRKMIEFNFETLKINRLEAVCSTANENSIRLLEACGFFYEGCLRAHRYKDGRYVDVYSYAILLEDYLAEPARFLKK